MGTVNLIVPPYEVTDVYTHPDAKVDIVLVHGLNGNPKRTWTSKSNNLFWPAELLPEALGLPPANILVYGYNSKVHGHATDNPIMSHAHSLVAHLSAHRRGQKTSHNPIIWIAHSLGGILVKRALLYSKDITHTDRESLRSIFVSTYAIHFLGTPHSGSNLASVGLTLQTLGSRFLPRAIFESEPILLRTLQNNSEILKEINNQFLEIYQQFQIHMVHENLKTDLIVTKALIVSAESASPQLANATYYGVEATHSGMCKFSDERAPGFRTMVSAIQEWIRNAPAVIQARWAIELEERDKHIRHEIDARERLVSVDPGPSPAVLEKVGSSTAAGPETSQDKPAPRPDVLTTGNIVSSPSLISAPEGSLLPPLSMRNSDTSTVRSEPFYFVPEKFRPNSYFVGRDEEIIQLHKLLRNPMRSSQGTSAVIIHSLHGGGKTHLARQYFFSHRDEFPGGLCWVRAKSIHEMEQFYWEIAMKGPLHEALNANGGPQVDMDDPGKAVDIVRKWFNKRQQWLIVFDAILFDTPGIERFIPDAKHTSIIYTSTQDKAFGDYRFDNPQMLKLGILRPEHARELLFGELDRADPSTEDQRLALELVKHLGCLPLMLHISARHLKATQEPLAKYLKTLKDRSRINTSDLYAYTAVHDELKARNATQALNLMYTLAYFDNRVPVGLLNLGLPALEIKSVATRDGPSKTRSLTATLKILIDFALLERTEAKSVSPASSRSSTRHGIERSVSRSVDVLLLHTVIQLFFASVLHDEKLSEVWIAKSAAVYCRAFDQAVDLMAKGPQVGLLDDYRCFKIHGHKILEHVTARMDKKNTSQSTLERHHNEVHNRIEKCNAAILRISKDAQKQIIHGMKSAGPVEIDYTIISVFERTNSISDSENSSRTSIATPTSSGGSRSLSPEIQGVTSRVNTFDSDGRVGPHVGHDQFELPHSSYPGGFRSWTDAEHHSATDASTKAQPAQMAGTRKQPMTRFSIDSQDDLDGSTIFHQSPDPIYSATVPRLQRPHPTDYRASGGPASYIPGGPQLLDESDNIGIDTTNIATPHVLNLSPTETEIYQPRPPAVSASHPDLRDQAALRYDDHRTVRRRYERRYHDSAGAWRQVGTADPRVWRQVGASVTVDYGSAEGSLVKPQYTASSTTFPQAATGTDAEKALRALSASSLRLDQNLATGPPGLGVAPNPSRSRAQSTGTLGVRPLLSIHEDYQDLGIYQSQPSPPIDTKQEKRKSDSAASFLLSSLGKLRRLLPSSRSGSSSSLPPRASHEQATPIITTGSFTAGDANNGGIYDNIQELIDASSRPPVRGSRTARSSPSQGYGPYQHPPYPVTDNMPHMYVDAYNTGRSHSDLPGAISKWNDESYHPGGTQMYSPGSAFGLAPEFRMDVNQSYPQPQSPPFMLQTPTLAGGQFAQRPQLLHPYPNADGYSSQPMSRGASSQSQPEIRNNGASIPRRLSSIAAATGDVQHRRHVRNSSSTSSGTRAGAGTAARTRSRPFIIPVLRRNSHSSLVETEPSPRTSDPFDIHTSYRDYEERRQRGHLAYRLGREGAAVQQLQQQQQQQELATGVQAAFQPRIQSLMHDGAGPSTVWRPGQSSHFAHTGSVAMSRSQSDTESVRRPRRGSDSLYLPAAGAWAGTGTGTGTGRAFTPLTNPYPMQIATVDGGEYTAEPMSRGASGGSTLSRRGSVRGPGAAGQHSLPRSAVVDGTGYTSEPMSRGASGSGHGSVPPRPNPGPSAASRSGRVLQDFGSIQPPDM